MGQRGQAVEEARRRHREADTRLLRQESGNRRRVAGALLVPEREDPQALALHETAKVGDRNAGHAIDRVRSEEHTSELQSLMRISYAVFCLKKKKIGIKHIQTRRIDR